MVTGQEPVNRQMGEGRGQPMRRVFSVFLIIMSMWLLVPASVGAAQLVGCRNAMDPIELNVGWVPADGVPAPGEDAWWDLTVDGIAAEGMTILEVAALYGESTELGFYEVVNTGIVSVDVNGNGSICVKPSNERQNGRPLYVFLVSDDKVR